MSMIRRLGARFGIDFHVGAALALRCWAIVGGLGMMIVIPVALDPQEQGYFFAFLSLLALQVFFELGLNQVLVQMVGHEVAYLHRNDDGTLVGEGRYLDRIKSIVMLAHRWYCVIAVMFVLVVATIGGFIFFRSSTLSAGQW